MYKKHLKPITDLAKQIFGPGVIDKVYMFAETPEALTTYLKQAEKPGGSSMSLENTIIKFKNGRTVQFNISEWGNCRTFEETEKEPTT